MRGRQKAQKRQPGWHHKTPINSANPNVWQFRFPNGDHGAIVDSGDGKPARKVRPGWQSKPTTTCISTKSERPLECESHNEYGAILICEYDRRVVRIRTQPYTVLHTNGSKQSRTYPDIEVVMSSGSRKIIQVKAKEKLTDVTVKYRLERDRLAFEANGWDYEIWTDEYVQAQPRLKNLLAIHHYRNYPLDPDLVGKLRASISNGEVRTIGGVYESLSPTSPREATLLMLVAARAIDIDVSQPIRPEAPVFLAP
jgi:hypothetical protein